MAERFERLFVSTGPHATAELGERLGQSLPAGSVLCVDGELGTGKTLFVKGLARGLGVEDEVDSPTFTLMKEYEGRLPLYHFDAWMQGRERAFLEGGADDLLRDTGISVIEWGSRIADLLPRPYLRIGLQHRAECERAIRLELEPSAPDPSAGRVLWSVVEALGPIAGLTLLSSDSSPSAGGTERTD